jgi:steroid 5-alpha reductase family enzyme
LVLSPTGSINLGFTTEGRLAVVLIITFSWGFQLGGYIYIKLLHQHRTTNKFSGTIAREKEDFCKGSLSLPIFYFVIVLLNFIFACMVLSKNTKKLVPS